MGWHAQYYLIYDISSRTSFQNVAHVRERKGLSNGQNVWYTMALRYFGSHTRYDGIGDWLNGIYTVKFGFGRLPTSTWELFHWKICRIATSSPKLFIHEISVFCHHCNKCEPLQSVSLITYSSSRDQAEMSSIRKKIISENNQLSTGDVLLKMSGLKLRWQAGNFRSIVATGRQFFVAQSSLATTLWALEHILYLALDNATFQENIGGDGEIYQSIFCLYYGTACGCHYKRDEIADALVYPNLNIIWSTDGIPLQFPLYNRTLGFAGCGHAPGSLPFRELFSSYDGWTWFVIVVLTGFLLPCAFYCTEHGTKMLGTHTKSIRPPSYIRYAHTSVKYLLEQGPFGDHDETMIRNVFSFRVVASVFLLTGIIFSNAYKSRQHSKNRVSYKTSYFKGIP